MGLKQELQAVRNTVGAVLHNTNTALADYGVPTVGTLAALPEALDAVHERGVAEGKRAAQDAFWDAYQENGTRGNYNRAFAGTGWDDTSFTPKYDIVPITGTSLMFSQCRITNLKTALERCGVVLDFSKATTMAQIFDNCSITDVGVIDMRSAKTCNLAFMSATNLKNVEKLIFKDDGSQVINATQTFMGCAALENIVIEGCIGYGTSLQWSSKLSRASIESVMAALSDSVTGQTVIFSQTAVAAAFTDAEWAALKATKPNWTVEVV